jgi:uncharacterized protein YxjI
MTREDMMFRRRQRQNQEGSEPGDQGSRYLLREKLLSIGDDFWIENDRGQRVFRVDAKVLRVRDTVSIKDTHGHRTGQAPKAAAAGPRHDGDRRRGRAGRHDQEGHHRPATGPVHHRPGQRGSMQTQGNILDHEYQITSDGIPVTNISKRWFRVRESYGVAVGPGQDDALVLAVAVCIDHLTD